MRVGVPAGESGADLYLEGKDVILGSEQQQSVMQGMECPLFVASFLFFPLSMSVHPHALYYIKSDM